MVLANRCSRVRHASCEDTIQDPKDLDANPGITSRKLFEIGLRKAEQARILYHIHISGPIPCEERDLGDQFPPRKL